MSDAHEQLVDERDERRRVLASLLASEREQTDQRLLLERARADATLIARDDFMSMVSHDLRTLLGGIALAAAVQLQTAGDDEAGAGVRAAAEKIKRYTGRMNRLIGDLVDVASLESGRLAVVPAPQNAAALIRDALEAFQPVAAARGIELGADLHDNTLLAAFDHDRVLQVLANILSNAIKFTPAGGRIRIRVAPEGGEILFTIDDTGSGVPTSQLEAVFERFWQVTPGDRRGLGLGLFISRCIVEAHGGRIWATSRPGAGSTFFFTLPRAS